MALFEDGGAARRGGGSYDPEAYQLAAAALLVEAAQMDDTFDERERGKILDLVTTRFGLRREEGESLIDAAEDAVARSIQLHGFTRTIKSAFDHEERVELLEMLWEVAYVDGKLHDYEANLIRRITGLLQISDRESGSARKRALQRLNRPGP